MLHIWLISVLGLLFLAKLTAVEACACHALHPTTSWAIAVAARPPQKPLARWAAASAFHVTTGRRYLARYQKSLLVLASAYALDQIVKHEKRKQARVSRIFATATEKVDDEETADTDETGDAPKTTEEPQKISDEAMSGAMVGSIEFYKNWISPLLPPACRFVPTCSQYGVQAIQEFGPSKGAILIAWRLLRCSPIGGKGYDPPKWPPVHYTYSSY
mmetsp:Transcript_2671/g.7411  ORF Transcript_2671/g.7411 Transcript_2671/m.7411 type:complete len:216 (-) Transcript_2671:1556-2203(-)